MFYTVFTDMWQALMNDVGTLCKEVMEANRQPEKQVYMSLPRPGVSKTDFYLVMFSVSEIV